MKEHHPSSNQNTIVFANHQESESISHLTQKHTTQNQRQNDLTFFSGMDNKQKKITKKPDTILQKLSMMAPQSNSHVYNFLNIMSINEHTLKDPSSSQSYFKSMFYTKNIEKVQLRKNAIILFSRKIEKTLTPVQYLIKRFQSFGDNAFHQLANSIQLTNRLYQNINFMPDLIKSYDGEPLSRFIEAMQEKAYMCKVAPNKIVLSRKLLQLLGEDMELYGLKLCKYKTPFRQISSGQSYYQVTKKSIENIGHVCEFLKKKLTFEQLQSKTCMEFNQYLFTKQQKKMYCRFKLYMPTPLINCVELIEQINEFDDCDRCMKVDPIQRRAIGRECNELRYLEAQTLRHLIQISDSMLMNNRKKLAGYIIKQQV